MLLRNLQHDGQPQARAIGLGAQCAVKRLEHQLPLGQRNARPRVFHLQHQSLGNSVGQHAGRDDAWPVDAGRGVIQGVVHQIAHQLLEQGRIAIHQHAWRAGLCALITQVNSFFKRTRNAFLHHLHGDGSEVTGLADHGGATALGAGQRQQLVHRVGGADAGAANLAQRLFELFGIGAFALGQVSLHAQARQRCLELVRSICQKALLRGDGVLEPHQQVIDRRHQRGHLHRHCLDVQRAQVVGLAGAYAFLKLVQRPDGPHQRQPHQQYRDGQNHKLRQHHALDDLRGQHRALVQRFGHLHQGQFGVRQIQLDPHVGDLDVTAAKLIIAQPHLARHRFFFVGGQGQVTLAAEVFTARAQHLVVHRVVVVRAQQFACRQGQVELHPAVADRHQLRQRRHVVLQRPVKRLARNALCHQPREHQADRPQQQQRRQHPVQNLAKQAALLALEEFHRAAVPPQSAIAPVGGRDSTARRNVGALFNFVFSPGNSRARAPWQCAPGLFRFFCAGGGYRPQSRCC